MVENLLNLIQIIGTQEWQTFMTKLLLLSVVYNFAKRSCQKSSSLSCQTIRHDLRLCQWSNINDVY